MAIRGVQVKDLAKVIRSLEKMGVEVQDLKSVFRQVGTKVAGDAKANVNTQTGALAASIRAGNAKNKAIVRAGSASVPYAGVQEFGGYNNITPMEYLQRAGTDNREYAIRSVDKGIADLINKLDLK